MGALNFIPVVFTFVVGGRVGELSFFADTTRSGDAPSFAKHVTGIGHEVAGAPTSNSTLAAAFSPSRTGTENALHRLRSQYELAIAAKVLNSSTRGDLPESSTSDLISNTKDFSSSVLFSFVFV